MIFRMFTPTLLPMLILLSTKFDKAFNSWQKIWLVSEIEPDLKDLSAGTKSGLEKLHLYISWFH